MCNVLRSSFTFLALLGLLSSSARAGVLQFGDADRCNTRIDSSGLKVGATLQGLQSGVVTFGHAIVRHAWPFAPSSGDHPGTDQIYVGTVQTAASDGYANSALRQNGPQVITLDYSSLVGAGGEVGTFTLGIAADDFQYPRFGQPFTASINGVVHTALTSVLNSVDQTGPVIQFFTIGLDPSLLQQSHVLTLSINQGGTGGDGWAIDFLTVGVTSTSEPPPPPAAVPEPTGCLLAMLGALGVLGYVRSRKRIR
jgi:hypothetical protein